MSDEAYVQVAADSTGKKIRNLEIDVLQTDGTVATVEMQVVSIANPDGSPVVWNDGIFESILKELRLIRLGMELLNDHELSLEDVEKEL